MKEEDVVFQQGEVILKEGEGGNAAYLLVSGKVEIFRGEKGNRQSVANVLPGTVFGEMALIDPAPRLASAIALERSRCRRITRAALNRALENSPPLARYLLQSFIRNIRTASGGPGDTTPMDAAPTTIIVSERQSHRVLERKAYAHGDIIFHQGSEGFAAYLIQAGEVDLLRESEDGAINLLRRLGPGEVFGELALVDPQPRYATAVSIHGTTLEIIRADHFNTLLGEAPAIVRALMRIYTAMIRSQSAAPR